ncbi:hypothetical protein ACTJJ0_33070 [Chitinophaga sp. 22321]|uniref:Uncharacterized protein n=1 Tax=Chitinophaga hostae TaxID=2831022 RepID=A0ABS5JAC0_9BACT|nr:hypothetical protein [Chitinophaga hostae]MBS0032046.1 hypothetical protein [Chitinophaga hostae]
MRNTRILLGATTLILAVAGAISTMASSRVKNAKILTTVGASKICVLFTSPCPVGQTVKCTTAGGKTVWTIASNCVRPFLRPAH